MHVWLIVNWLRDFTKNKFAIEFADILVSHFEAKIASEVENLDVLWKGKKIDDIRSYLLSIRE